MGVTARYVAFFVLAVIAIIMTTVACCLILRFGDRRASTATRLLLSIFITLLVEEITTLPFVYTWNNSFCGFVAVVHTYSGLANAIAIGSLMMYFHCSHTCNERIPFAMSTLIRDWSRFAIFVFPFITLLPFSTNSFGRDDVLWCRIQTTDQVGNLWSVLVFHLWVVAIMLIAVVMISRSIYAAYKIHMKIGGRLLSSIGSYSMVAFVIWLFRLTVIIGSFFTADRSSELLFVSELVIQIMGIAFSVIFFLDMSIIIDFRTGSEVMNKSSILCGSILNWESIIDSLQERSTTADVVTPL